ncbi:hypothetical protein HPB49_009424 [Dermacentor silvarum]|uniref:Uncharacterized protein n=1 Tax=Dermacentor silvarum TaxID=543639 RepID=A0ACB8DZD2_DERSI|nr:hypothetical protein HPB49_009424 [Dermacentor silvarum]
MEPTLEEERQPPASDERPKSTPELTPKPLRPGILKSPPGSAEPLKQASTKTLRFKMDESPEPVPPASPTAPAPPAPPTTSAPPASTSQMTAVPGEAVALRQTSEPVQHKGRHDRMGDSPEISPSLSEGTEETLSEGHSSSSSSSSSSQSGDDWDVPGEHPAKSNAPSAATAAATAPAVHGLLGDHSVKMPSWIPDDMMRYFSSFGRKEGDKVLQEAGASRTALEIEDADDEDDTSLSPPLEDANPWRTPLVQCALVALLGVLTLVLVVAAVAEASRKSVSQSVAKRELDVDDAITTVGPEESHDYMPVPQVPLNDIEESSRRAAATVRSSGNTEGDASFFRSDSVEDASALVATSETQVIPSTSGERPQEILGKVRQLKGHTIRPSRKGKEPRVCDPPSFTYCRAARPEFYYNHSSGDCEAASHQVQLCNRGPNRFPSKHSCHLKCVERKRPDDLCSQVVSFVKCTRQDYKHVTRWYFDGERCRRWRHSRRDRCLSDHDQVFTTVQDCRSSCIAVNASECHVPKLTDCGVPQRLSPYFAHRTRQSDPFHCISVSSLRKNRDGQHVCLKGANRFRTVHACRETCAHGGK